MKSPVIALAALGVIAVGAAAQQPATPLGSSHPADNASFGNKKPAKKDKAPTSRTVTGQVTDQSGQLLQGAMVTLTDKRTNEKISFFTKKDGKYQFEDLSFNNDYEVQARYKTFSSDARKVSQFDALPRPVRLLEIDTGAKTADTAARKDDAAPPKL